MLPTRVWGPPPESCAARVQPAIAWRRRACSSEPNEDDQESWQACQGVSPFPPPGRFLVTQLPISKIRRAPPDLAMHLPP